MNRAATAPAAYEPRLSSADLPMFFAEHHHALSASLLASAARFSALGEAHDRADAARSAVRALAETRLFGLLVPEPSSDPPRIDIRALCLARELLGQLSPLADSIFAVQGLGSHPIVLAGTPEQKARLLPRVESGESIGAFALTEPDAGSDVGAIATRARKDGGDYVLDGEKTFISNAGLATHYIVFANADPSLGKKGITAFVVDAGTPGLSTEPIPMSVDHPIGKLSFDGCRVPESALVGAPGAGLGLALATLDAFRVSVGAAAVGMARRALDETIDRVRTRRQFGKALSEQQTVQSYVAEMATESDAARLLVYRAAWHKDAKKGRVPVEAAMAKLYATEAAQRIIDRAVQLFGGLGVTLGTTVERLYREVRPLRIYEGTTEIQRLIIAREVLGSA